MRDHEQPTIPLRVGDRVEVSFGAAGRVIAIAGSDVQIELDSGPIVSRSAVELEIVGIAHDFFLPGQEDRSS